MDRAVVASARATPATRPHLQQFLATIHVFLDAHLMEYVERTLLSLSERQRRCLASFGAVNGLSCPNFARSGTDRLNVIYASVWEVWKGEVPTHVGPVAVTVTHACSAGNVIEAMMGAGWLYAYDGQCVGGLSDAASFSRTLRAAGFAYFCDVSTP